MATPEQQDLPRGFTDTVRSWQAFSAGRRGGIVHLPADGVRDGPFLRLPDRPFETLIIDSFTESLGVPERFFELAADRLPPDGEVLVEIDNAQAPHALRIALEGRPSSFDAHGSLRDPAHRLLPRRAVHAIDAAGLRIGDVVASPSYSDAVGPEFANNAMREGFLAGTYIGGPPPARLWIRARKAAKLRGSALIGTGPDELQAVTERCVREFLPPEWEILRGRGDDEVDAFNDLVASATGELCWFLRAGSQPSQGLFDALIEQSAISPAAPTGNGNDNDAMPAPDGWLLPRIDLLWTGPIPRRWTCPQIAYEDWSMRLEVVARAPQRVAEALVAPAFAYPDAALFGAESRELMAIWQAIGHSDYRSDDNPVARTGEAREVPWEGREPRISLVMIARDEEQLLPECLRLAAPAVDEIVLVDTGSVDRTVAIAESFGATVLHTEWQDDFSTPRNLGLEAATGDWILALDADEMLEEAAPARLRDLCRDGGVCGYHMVFRNIYSGGKTQGVTMVRLFRNLPEVRYENRIHEQVTPSLMRAAANRNLMLSSCDVQVEHVGYDDEIMRSRQKDARNERLFLQQVREQPDDIYTLYKYGDFLRRLPGRNREAREVLERTLERILEEPPAAARNLPYAGEVAALCALEYAREDMPDRAAWIIETALTRFIPTPNLHYIAASLALHAGRNDEAVAHYERCLSYRDQVLVVPIQEGVTSWVSLTGIAQAWMQRGAPDRALQLVEQALRVQPTYDVAALVLSRIWFERGDYARALNVLTDYLAVEPNSAGVCQQAAIILGRLGQADHAQRMGRRAIELLEAGALDREADKMRETMAALC